MSHEEYLRASIARLRALTDKEMAMHVALIDSIAKKLGLSSEHDHNSHTCETCEDRYDEGFNRGYDSAIEKGKVSLKPFDVDSLASFFADYIDDMDTLTAYSMARKFADHFAAPELKPFDSDSLANFLEKFIPDKDVRYLASAIANHFAAPERKPWAIAPNDVFLIQKKNKCGGDAYGIAAEFARLCNEHFALQPAPVEDVEERCPRCDHKDSTNPNHPTYCGHAHCFCLNEIHRKVDE